MGKNILYSDVKEVLHTSIDSGTYLLSNKSNIIKTNCISSNTYIFEKSYTIDNKGKISNYRESELNIPQKEK